MAACNPPSRAPRDGDLTVMLQCRWLEKRKHMKGPSFSCPPLGERVVSLARSGLPNGGLSLGGETMKLCECGCGGLVVSPNKRGRPIRFLCGHNNRQDAEERFWAKVDKNGPIWNGTPCWLWLGSQRNGGYGQFWDGLHIAKAHRFAYELLIGPIPDGLEPDHLCRNRTCVSPTHLEVVTHRVNLLRGTGFPAQNARKTHCPQGHPYSGRNIYVDKHGWRECRECDRTRKGGLDD